MQNKKGLITIPRIISGSARKLRLEFPRGCDVRPTADNVKEALFNIISPLIPGAVVLDLFAGTGSLGIEALSRGAARAVFTDSDPSCCATVGRNLEKARLSANALVIQGSSPSILSRIPDGPFDILFLDPPYGRKLIEKTMDNIRYGDIIKEKTLIAAEHHAREVPSLNLPGCRLIDRRNYGEVTLSFYIIDAPDAD